MKKFAALLALSTPVYANEFHVIEPTHIAIETYKYVDLYDPYIAPLDQTVNYGGDFTTDLNVVRYHSLGLYWNNQLHFDESATSGQIVRGGWQYELGLKIWPLNGPNKVEVFKQHHSQHIFDRLGDTDRFPVYDRYGVRFNIYP